MGGGEMGTICKYYLFRKIWLMQEKISLNNFTAMLCFRKSFLKLFYNKINEFEGVFISNNLQPCLD